MKTLEQLLQELYTLEINVSLESEWDGGWYVKIGDKMNGFTFVEEGRSLNLEQVKTYLTKRLEEIKQN